MLPEYNGDGRGYEDGNNKWHWKVYFSRWYYNTTPTLTFTPLCGSLFFLPSSLVLIFHHILYPFLLPLLLFLFLFLFIDLDRPVCVQNVKGVKRVTKHSILFMWFWKIPFCTWKALHLHRSSSRDRLYAQMSPLEISTGLKLVILY